MEDNHPTIDPGPPPAKCPNPDCDMSNGFDLVSVEFQCRVSEWAESSEPVAMQRVSRWKCRACGCHISYLYSPPSAKESS